VKEVALDDVAVRFGKVEALDGVSVRLGAGEVVMLAGPNGAGKSTLMRVLLGLVRPDRGSLAVDGQAAHVDASFKSRLAYLPEAVAFSENLSGRQVLRFFSRARGVARARVEEVLRRVGLDQAASRAVRGYSRGMRQRLGLAVAILSEPELLILDEPTGGLDQEGLGLLWSILEEWRQKGRFVLLSAHDLGLLERRVDRMCVLCKGQLVADDAPGELRAAVSLPHRVRMRLDLAANGQISGLAEAVRTLDACIEVRREGDLLDVQVAPSGLLDLMDVRSRFPDAVTALRVEEPPLDLVYERLLEGR